VADIVDIACTERLAMVVNLVLNRSAETRRSACMSRISEISA